MTAHDAPGTLWAALAAATRDDREGVRLLVEQVPAVELGPALEVLLLAVGAVVRSQSAGVEDQVDELLRVVAAEHAARIGGDR